MYISVPSTTSMSDKVKASRRAFDREFKLQVVKEYHESGKNIAKTARKFEIDRKQVRAWVKKEEQIRGQKYKSKAHGRGCNSKYPLMEDKLYSEFLQLRKDGRKVKRWWFNTRAKQLMADLYPDVKDFKHSDQWFKGFRNGKNVSLRKRTHAAQHAPPSLRGALSKFHAKLLRVRRRGKFELSDIANMDQTPLPFVLDDGKTYNDKGEKEIWCATAASGLDKRQCTVQLTIFADGKPRVRPTIIFRGQGKRVSKTEKDAWDSRVCVMFQEKAWCDEAIMKAWIDREWSNTFTNPHNPCSSGKILVADVHTAQQTEAVKTALGKYKTELVNVPPGCTSRVQPLDVSVNKPFKEEVKRQHEKHMSDNLQLYTESKLSAWQRRVLLTKWVAEAWKEINRNKETVIRSFKKCGVSLTLDGKENDEINIEGIPDYEMPQADEIDGAADVEFHLESEDDSEDNADEEAEYEADETVGVQ